MPVCVCLCCVNVHFSVAFYLSSAHEEFQIETLTFRFVIFFVPHVT